ncbi:MAG TPA: cyanophycin synthetase [Mycobacteriales bacterium]|jgi:cyanophycin synthetase|nr:cyanophycin synthetase [Mycobacteriales bacterium]
MRVEVLERRVYRGPNYWSYDPAIRFVVDLGELEEHPSNVLPGFVDRLVELLPGLADHTCSRGYRGGFLERLREGTWLGHVSEHVALELQKLTGSEIRRGKTRGTGEPGRYNVIYGYADETVGLAAGDLAVRIVNHLVEAEDGFDVQVAIEDLIRTANRVAFGPSTQAIVDEAAARDIPWLRLDEHSLVQLGQGVYQKRIRATMTSATPVLGTDIASDKALTARLLAAAGLPVPGTTVVRNADDALSAAKRIGYPVVVKPLDGNHGRGVALGVGSEDELLAAFEVAQREARRGGVVVERFVVGADHRLLVVGGRLVAAARRVPAHVVGDGTHTVAELVEIENADPRRGIGHEKVLTRIRLDARAEEVLARQGYTLADVPGEGETVFLAQTANMSTGGIAEDVTERVHPDNVEIAELAAEVVGLDVAGIDLVSPDIELSVHDVGGAIVEVNAAPGFRMHTHPTIGEPQYVAKPVVDLLFPPGTPSRIPIVAVTGTNGKTTTTRMIAHIFRRAGRKIGLTSTDGIAIGDRLVIPGDSSGPKSARMVLQNPRVDMAIFEVARGGILREGLGYERNDVAVVLNVAADHLGLRGIDTLDELARVKQVVVEAVPRHGFAVLNADDPRVLAMRKRCSGDVVLFSMERGHEEVERHVRRGGRAVVLDHDGAVERIVYRHGSRAQSVVRTDALPATFGGRARMNVQNAMAAVGAAIAAGAHLQDVRLALQSFTPSFETSPGRMNMTEVDGVTVVVDYCHNAHGMRMLGDFVDRWTADAPAAARRVAVVATPGDRRDVDIRDLGRAAAPHFDHLVVPSRISLRGRKPGEMPALVAEGIDEAVAAGAKRPSLEVVGDEPDAVAAAFAAATAGDLVVLCAESPTLVWNLVQARRSSI